VINNLTMLQLGTASIDELTPDLLDL